MNCTLSQASLRATSTRRPSLASRFSHTDASHDQSGDCKESTGESAKRVCDEAAEASNEEQNQPAERAGCDCRVVATVKQRWASSGYAAFRIIECHYDDGVLFIRGTVLSYYYKQMAQESIRSVDGVDRIVNELSVDD